MGASTRVPLMLAGHSIIDQVLNHYPEELRSQLREDILMVLRRDRSFWVSQIQLSASKYSCACPMLTAFRADLDEIILSLTQ